jgi:hypothetical protein
MQTSGWPFVWNVIGMLYLIAFPIGMVVLMATSASAGYRIMTCWKQNRVGCDV